MTPEPPDPAAYLLVRSMEPNPICYAVRGVCQDCDADVPLPEPILAHASAFRGECLLARCEPCSEAWLVGAAAPPPTASRAPRRRSRERRGFGCTRSGGV